jgi:hypothetical protein
MVKPDDFYDAEYMPSEFEWQGNIALKLSKYRCQRIIRHWQERQKEGKVAFQLIGEYTGPRPTAKSLGKVSLKEGEEDFFSKDMLTIPPESTPQPEVEPEINAEEQGEGSIDSAVIQTATAGMH